MVRITTIKGIMMITRSIQTINFTQRASKVNIRRGTNGVNHKEGPLTKVATNRSIKLNTRMTNIRRIRMCIKRIMVSIKRKNLNNSKIINLNTKRRVKIMIKQRKMVS